MGSVIRTSSTNVDYIDVGCVNNYIVTFAREFFSLRCCLASIILYFADALKIRQTVGQWINPLLSTHPQRQSPLLRAASYTPVHVYSHPLF
jgi:hypothetical protein